MSRSGFLTKSLGKTFLGGNKQISCHGYVLLHAYYCHLLHSFYILVSYLGERHCAMASPLQKSETDSKIYFLEITMFLG